MIPPSTDLLWQGLDTFLRRHEAWEKLQRKKATGVKKGGADGHRWTSPHVLHVVIPIVRTLVTNSRRVETLETCLQCWGVFPWVTSVWLFLYFIFCMFSMFLVKSIGNRIFFFWKPQGVLQKTSPFLALCSSAELGSRTEGKAQLLPWKGTAPKNTLTQMASTVSWDLQFPLQCLSHGGDLLAFTTAGFVPYFRAGRWEMKSQRNLYHCNLMLVLVREEGVYFLPLHPSHLEGSESWRGALSKKHRADYWK